MNRSAMLLALGALVLPIFGCGSDDEPDTEPVTFEGWAGSVITDYDPATSLAELSSRSTVVTEATLVDIEDGAIFGSSPDDEAASHSVNLIFETEGGERYYVERPRPGYMGIDELRSMMPLGAASVIYLQPNNDPRGQNYFNVRDGPTWFFTTPQGWILDDPERGIVTPLESLDMLEFEPPADGDPNLRAWLVDSQASSSTVSVPDADREALIASGDPSVVLDCPGGRLPLPSPAYEYAENTPVFDTELFDDLVRFETELWDAVDERLRREVGLPLSWFEPMTVIEQNTTCRVNDIADALSITIGGTSKLVDRRERAGLWVRRPNPDDRRSSLIALTPAGEQQLVEAAVVCDGELARWFALPDSTLERFHAVLRRLRVNARTRRHHDDQEVNDG